MSRQHPNLKTTTSAMWQAIRRFMVGTDGTAGSALVEFTIFVPLLVMISMYMMDFGLLIWRKMDVQHAAQAGAQYVMEHGCSSSSISSAVKYTTNWTTNGVPAISANPAPSCFLGCPSISGVTQMSTPVLSCSNTSSCPSPSPSTKCSDGSEAGTYVTVSAQATSYKSLTPYGLVPSSWGNLTAQTTVRIQ